MTLISPPLLSQHPSIPPSKSDFSLLLRLNLYSSIYPFFLALFTPLSQHYHLTDSYWCASNDPHVSKNITVNKHFVLFTYSLFFPFASFPTRLYKSVFFVQLQLKPWIQICLCLVFGTVVSCLFLTEACLTKYRKKETKGEGTLSVLETALLIFLKLH